MRLAEESLRGCVLGGGGEEGRHMTHVCRHRLQALATSALVQPGQTSEFLPCEW